MAFGGPVATSASDKEEVGEDERLRDLVDAGARTKLPARIAWSSSPVRTRNPRRIDGVTTPVSPGAAARAVEAGVVGRQTKFGNKTAGPPKQGPGPRPAAEEADALAAAPWEGGSDDGGAEEEAEALVAAPDDVGHEVADVEVPAEDENPPDDAGSDVGNLEGGAEDEKVVHEVLVGADGQGAGGAEGEDEDPDEHEVLEGAEVPQEGGDEFRVGDVALDEGGAGAEGEDEVSAEEAPDPAAA